MEKICSMITVPPSRNPTCSPMTVITGIAAFFSACLSTTREVPAPLAHAVRT